MEHLKELLQDYEADAIAFRRNIHEQPELSMEETLTTERIRSKLEEYQIPLCDIKLPSGTAGILTGQNTEKTILFRADIDALPMPERSGLPFASQNPGVCHSCGHDIHTSALLLAARVLGELRETLPCNVIFLFQPAEENGKGARAVIESGLIEQYQPQMAVGLHCWPELPAGTIGLRKGSFMASSDTVRICVKGQGGHGAHPHKSHDPVTAAAYILTQLQTVVSRTIAPLDSAVLSIGKIAGGTAANIIPDEVVMEGTVRTVSNTTRAMMEEQIRMVAGFSAQAMGCKCEIEYIKGMPALVCDPGIVDRIESAAVQVLGREKAVFLETPSMGSEDFASYLDLMPGAMFRVGTANDNPMTRRPLHNSEIIFDEKAIITGAAVFCQTALNIQD